MSTKISLKAARVNAELTQDDVSKELKISKQTLISWEKNESTPSVTQARKLSELYNYPLDNIYFFEK